MAKAKVKATSITNWEKMIVDQDQTVTLTANGEEFEITVSPTLSWEEAGTMVNYVVAIVFDEQTGEYHPEVKDALIRSQVLERYAHFNMPKSFDKMYHLVYATDAYDFVSQVINQAQLDQIKAAIDDALDYRLNILASGVQAEIQKIMDSFDAFNENAESMFSKVNPDELSSFVKNVAEMPGSLDEEKVVSLVHAANMKEE